MRINKTSSIKFLLFPELNNLELVCGKDVGNSFPLHMHKTLNVGVIEKGSACLSTLSASFTLNESNIFIINPRETHAIKPISAGEDYSYTVLCITVESLRRTQGLLSRNENSLPYFANSVLDNSKLLVRLRKLFAILEVDGKLEEKEELFLELMMELFLNCDATYMELCNNLGEREELMHNVRKEIEQRCMENLTLRELSNIASLSPYHFLRTFKREIGISPYTYQLQRRIKNAQQMLTPETSISDVAQKTGFNDQSHFTRFFKKVVGITPGQYVRANKNEG